VKQHLVFLDNYLVFSVNLHAKTNTQTHQSNNSWRRQNQF